MAKLTLATDKNNKIPVRAEITAWEAHIPRYIQIL
jgi:hypothetical protein